MRIELPWPSAVLSPNSRAHWRIKAEHTRSARHEARVVTLSELRGGKPTIPAMVPMTWTFRPTRAGRIDRDNCIARCKALQDGIADALGVDDSRFEPTYRIGEPIKGGAVVVEVRL